ncbi:MAG: hypothetical protein DYH12_28730 [Sorangiineae bacterium PRO1]|nr:hypothetical protein [Sorangiineae bacterium PRO1]
MRRELCLLLRVEQVLALEREQDLSLHAGVTAAGAAFVAQLRERQHRAARRAGDRVLLRRGLAREQDIDFRALGHDGSSGDSSASTAGSR